VTATTRRALVLGPPLVLGLLELGHPGVMPGTPIAATPGAPWPIVALLAVSGLLLGFSHIRPFGPLACGALLVAAGWIESAGARRRAALRPA